MSDTVEILLEMEENQAYELAQLCKRITFTHFQELSSPVEKDEPYVMRDAVVTLQKALADAGFAPR